MKSFLRTGTETARFASPRCSGAPRKNPASVSTESAAAPACSYIPGMAATSAPGLISPLDGEARLISAMTAMPAAPRSAWDRSRGGSAVVASSIMRRTGDSALSRATCARLAWTIRSRMSMSPHRLAEGLQALDDAHRPARIDRRGRLRDALAQVPRPPRHEERRRGIDQDHVAARSALPRKDGAGNRDVARHIPARQILQAGASEPRLFRLEAARRHTAVLE